MKTMLILAFLTVAFTVFSSAQFPNYAITTDTKAQSEMAIAASPLNGNNLFAAWADGGTASPYNVHVGYKYSTDGGISWNPSSYSPLTPSIGSVTYNYISD